MLLYIFAAFMVLAALATAIGAHSVGGALICAMIAGIALYVAARSGGRFS